MMANIEWAGLKRALLVAAVLAVVALLNVGALPVLLELYEGKRIAGHWYHPAFAALCVVPAAVAHGTASHAGARGAGWWLLWVPGVALYAAYPWPDRQGDWQPLWIFSHAWAWAKTIVLNWDTAGPFVFNSFGAFVVMVVVAAVTFGRLWFGAAKAFGRAGSDVLAPGDGGKALPNAAWASRREIAKRFSAPGGIVLGELTDPVRQSRNFKPDRKRSWGRQGRGQLITMSAEDGNGHVLVTSQASGYKSTGLVIPNILTYKGPLVVFDPKCELYARTRHAREAMQRTPVVIDGNNGFDPARLIAALAKEHPSAYRRMAKMVIPAGHGGIENSQYFKDAATNLFTALLAYHGEIGSTNILQNISRLLALSPKEIHKQTTVGRVNSKLPFVQNELNALKDMDLKFWYSVKTEITNQLLFGAMPDVERYITMKPGSKLPTQVIDPKCDVFLNIPQHIAEDFAPMLRLMLGSMLTAAQLVEVNEAPSARRLFLIDEAAKLGNMDILENIRDRGRSVGLHLMMVYQTPGDIERIWGRAGMTAWRDGCSATVMGPVTSRTSAQDVSAMIGTRTVRVGTESTSSSTNVMSPMAGSVSTTVQEQLRDVPLISPTAISQLPRHASIITSPGSRPIRASKAIWFTREDMRKRVRSTKDIEDELDVKGKRKKATEQLEEIARTEAEEAEAAGESRPSGPELAAMQRRNMDDDPEDEVPEPKLSELAMARFPRIDSPYVVPAAVRDEEARRHPGKEAEGVEDGTEVAPPVPEGGETWVEDRVDAERATAPASGSGNVGDGGHAPAAPGDDADATVCSPVRAQPQPGGDGVQGAEPESAGAGLASASPEEVPADGRPTSGATGQAAADGDGDGDSPPSGPDLMAMQRRNMDDGPEEAVPQAKLSELARTAGRRVDTSDEAPARERGPGAPRHPGVGAAEANGNVGPQEAMAGDAESARPAQDPGESSSSRDGKATAGVPCEDVDGHARDPEAKAGRVPPPSGPSLAALQRRNMDDGPEEAVPQRKLLELARAIGRRVDTSGEAPAADGEGAVEAEGSAGPPEAIAGEAEPARPAQEPGEATAERNAKEPEEPPSGNGDDEPGDHATMEAAAQGSEESARLGAESEAAAAGAERGERPGQGDVNTEPATAGTGVAANAGGGGPEAVPGESFDATIPTRDGADGGNGEARPAQPGATGDPDTRDDAPGVAAAIGEASPSARDGDALSPGEAERFADLSSEGMSLEEIAGELRKSVATVAAWDREQRARGLLPDGVRGTGRARAAGTPDSGGPGGQA